MREKDIHNALIASPSLIEEGLTFKEREVNLDGKRCDLLFVDKSGNHLYVEVKKQVTEAAIGQLLMYDCNAGDYRARFMLVGLHFQPGVKRAIRKVGYEYKELSQAELESYIKRLKWEGTSQAVADDERYRQQLRVESRLDFLLNELGRLKTRVKDLENERRENEKWAGVIYVSLRPEKIVS